MRLFWRALLVTALLPVPAAAQGLGAENCRVTRTILSEAIAGRRAGEAPEVIVTRLSTGEAAVAGPYRLTVAPLVDLVFKLDPQSLSEETAALYEAQCLAYKP